ncbi:MAG: M20/M25/M40 family metallo-hydrolase [Acidobacteria bacterium]|nr:M20/M25/M40 family metallo-hydrolase [Acidobacteriota bacterium]
MTKRLVFLFLSFCLFRGLQVLADEKIDTETNWRIRREVTENSRIMNHIHHLTDVFGPRLTGSPNFRAACDWSLRQMKQWGMQNENLEKWDFAHPGWSSDKYIIRVLSPFKDTLNARVVAWTPGTKGPVRAKTVQITPPDRPTEESLTAYLNSVKARVRDRIVFVGVHKEIPIQFNPANKRGEDSELRAQYDPANPAPPAPYRQPDQPAGDPKILEPRLIEERIDAFLLESGALVRVHGAARTHGQIQVFANNTFNAARALPGIVIRNEDYGRISRLMADGIEIEMEVEISNTIHSEEQSFLNVVAEIPGSDLRNQVVMMGAHIDSWHAGTGATDNAAGVAVMLEAARIMQALGIQPRRTIRVALWGGEEQGLLGSKSYVKDHFGSFESQKLEFANLSAYINLDSGTGRVRGASVFGPAEAADALRNLLDPFADLGVIGASAIKTRSYGGTDSYSFSWAGLPGINLSQDPIEYRTNTWHTDLDTYERILEGDLKQCVIVVASLAYHLAMRDEMLPRFPADSMPPPEY